VIEDELHYLYSRLGSNRQKGVPPLIQNRSFPMKNRIVRACFALVLCCNVALAFAIDYAHEPTDKAALDVTKNLYTYLATRRDSIENKMIMGQHLGGINEVLAPPFTLNYDIHIIDGKGPGMVGVRYDARQKVGDSEPPETRPPYVLDKELCTKINNSLIALWKDKQPIIHITATPRNPWSPENGREPTKEPQSPQSIEVLLADAPWSEEKQSFWKEIKLIAEALAELQREGIPVVFRPFAEFNQSNKYYYLDQKPEHFVQLWKDVYKAYTGYGLHNLLFTWEVWALNRSDAEADLEPWYPEGFVDIVAGSFYFRTDIAYIVNDKFRFPPEDEKNDQMVYDFLISKDRPFGAAQWGLNQDPPDCPGNATGACLTDTHKFTLAFMNANPDMAFASYWDSPQAVEEQKYASEFVVEPRVATVDDLPKFTPGIFAVGGITKIGREGFSPRTLGATAAR
jgi:hypothetical protein